MKAHEQALNVEGCGNPKHGPYASCWKVVDVFGNRVIQGVQKDVADLYAAAPDMVRALLASGRIDPGYPDSAWHTHECWDNGKVSCEKQCTLTRAALTKADAL